MVFQPRWSGVQTIAHPPLAHLHYRNHPDPTPTPNPNLAPARPPLTHDTHHKGHHPNTHVYTHVPLAELPSSAGTYVEAAIPLCIQRQAVRLLAMLACDKAGAGEVEAAGWIPWLQDLALSQDLKLSSCASRALLHIESAAATERPGLTGLALSRAALRGSGAPLLPTEQHGSAVAAACGSPGGSPPRGAPGSPDGEAAGVVAEAAEMLGEARHALAQVRRRLDRKLDAVRPPLPPEQRLVMQVGTAGPQRWRRGGCLAAVLVWAALLMLWPGRVEEAIGAACLLGPLHAARAVEVHLAWCCQVCRGGW